MTKHHLALEASSAALCSSAPRTNSRSPSGLMAARHAARWWNSSSHDAGEPSMRDPVGPAGALASVSRWYRTALPGWRPSWTKFRPQYPHIEMCGSACWKTRCRGRWCGAGRAGRGASGMDLGHGGPGAGFAPPQGPTWPATGAARPPFWEKERVPLSTAGPAGAAAQPAAVCSACGMPSPGGLCAQRGRSAPASIRRIIWFRSSSACLTRYQAGTAGAGPGARDVLLEVCHLCVSR